MPEYFGGRSRFRGGTRGMTNGLSGTIYPPPARPSPSRPTPMFRGTPPAGSSPLRRLVPSGSPGGPGRPPLVRTPASGIARYYPAGRLAGRLIGGPLRLLGVIEDFRTLTEYFFPEGESNNPWDEMYAKTSPNDYHSHYKLLKSTELDLSPTVCAGTGTFPTFPMHARRPSVYAGMNDPLPACQQHGPPFFQTFDLAASGQAIGEFTTRFKRRSITFGVVDRQWIRISAGTTSSTLVQPVPILMPDFQPVIREKAYPQRRPFLNLMQQPAFEFGGHGRGKPVDHAPVPPKLPDKENKSLKAIPYGAFGKWYGRATELNDMLDCMMEAAGEDNPKGPLPKRLKMVWDRYNDPDKPAPDGNKFAMCMARENAQDAAIGALSRGGTRAMNRSPYASQRPGGYRGGGWGTRMHNFGG